MHFFNSIIAFLAMIGSVVVAKEESSRDEGVMLGQGYFVSVTKSTPLRIIGTETVKQGDTCFSVFKRLGIEVDINQCQRAARNAEISVLWHRPKINRPASRIVDIRPGDKAGVLEENGNKTPFFFKREGRASQTLSRPV